MRVLSICPRDQRPKTSHSYDSFLAKFTMALQTRLYTPTFLAIDKPELAASLERTDKLVVYSGWLHELHDVLDSGQPLIFEVENDATGSRVHAGILEFSGDQHG